MRDDAQQRHLRRGAWYPVLSCGLDEVVLVVRQKPLVVRLSFLEIVDTPPSKWTVLDGGHCAVCPNCAERVAVGTLSERMSCGQCGGVFEFERKGQGIGNVARERGELSSLEYDVFEVLPDGSRVRRDSQSGLEAAWEELSRLAKRTTNELLAIHTRTRHVVAQVNVPLVLERARKRIFQVAYTEALGIARSEELTRRGYRVTTVIGNERAKRVLTDSPQHYDLFIVAHAAPKRTRDELVAWLRANYPDGTILALNPVRERLRRVNYNAPLDRPETWVPIIARALG
ncbi:MAG TPA: hypothetical protein VH116_03555 [Gemmatimonadales bacterium]|nr:hypothetical protein [Gemmatimonadales bacterium]